MKLSRKIAGALSLLISAFLVVQYFANGLGPAVFGTETLRSAGGLFMIICMALGGVILLAAKSGSKAIMLAMALFWFGAAAAFFASDFYRPLAVWGGISMGIGILCVVFHGMEPFGAVKKVEYEDIDLFEVIPPPSPAADAAAAPVAMPAAPFEAPAGEASLNEVIPDTAAIATEVIEQPGVMPEDNAAPVETPEFAFTGGADSAVFHCVKCLHMLKPSKNRVYFATRDEALHAGRRPCKECKP
ncbi:MAG: hypothetical protein FWE91_10495 [Defluviitaleaceae bacterium]|nr:hypothetical protein [Defluviitaleaceae bacterium]MCL2837147.1 hypothetical protein [Defluviitaleaceae bacterium]